VRERDRALITACMGTRAEREAQQMGILAGGLPGIIAARAVSAARESCQGVLHHTSQPRRSRMGPSARTREEVGGRSVRRCMLG
jgi:hypothetical protein